MQTFSHISTRQQQPDTAPYLLLVLITNIINNIHMINIINIKI